MDIHEKLNAAIQILSSIADELSQSSPALPLEKVNWLSDRICLNCGKKIEETAKIVRGCHEYCAKQIANAIRAGEITDAEAIKSGIIAPPSPPGRKVDTATGLAKMRHKKIEESQAQAKEKLAAFRKKNKDQ